MKTSEVLNKAADLIQERGWVQGYDEDPWGVGSENAPLCLEGGIAAATGCSDLVVETCPAYMAVRDHLSEELTTLTGRGFGHQRVYRWNDQLERTASEVIEVLRATAVIEAAREDARVEVSA